MARQKAGDHVWTTVEMAGRPHSIWWHVGGQDAQNNPYKVTVHSVTYVKRTPAGPNADYGPVGQPGYPNLTVFDKDRPGPIAVADDVVVAVFEYSCPVESNLFAA